MDDHLDELKNVLQLLALPVTGQVRLVRDDCTRVDQLASAFAHAHDAVRADGDIPLTRERAGALAQLDDHLARLSGSAAQDICSELALRRSIEWRQVRTMARESLASFGWRLEVPLPALSAVRSSWPATALERAERGLAVGPARG